MIILKIKKYFNLFILKFFINKKLSNSFINLTRMFFEELEEMKKHNNRKSKKNLKLKNKKLEEFKKRLALENDEEEE